MKVNVWVQKEIEVPYASLLEQIRYTHMDLDLISLSYLIRKVNEHKKPFLDLSDKSDEWRLVDDIQLTRGQWLMILKNVP